MTAAPAFRLATKVESRPELLRFMDTTRIGRAPIGYLNTLDRVDGREIRSVAIDPERAPFV